MNAIETENLFKSYDGLTVLRGLNVQIPGGQVYGLLGPNGAGKSTLMHLLLGFLKPDRGSIRVFGSPDLEQARQQIGYIPERLRYHLRYTAREYLRYLGQFSGLGGAQLRDRIDEELRAVGLREAADRMLGTYSKGMLQRLGIAQALLTDPELLLIDEPTSGLDPAGQREMLDLLGEVRQRGHTILLTTHFLDEIDYLCDRAGILFNGKIATEIDVAALRVPGRNVTINVGPLPPDLAPRLMRLSPAMRISGTGITLQPNTPLLQAQVLRMLLDANVAIIALEPQARPLEELYLRIVRGEPVESTEPAPVVDSGQTVELPRETLVGPSSDTAPGRPGTGDTLLRELLNREEPRD